MFIVTLRMYPIDFTIKFSLSYLMEKRRIPGVVGFGVVISAVSSVAVVAQTVRQCVVQE